MFGAGSEQRLEWEGVARPTASNPENPVFLRSRLPVNGRNPCTTSNRQHLEQCCNVPRPSVPDAFLDINRSARLDGLSDNQSVDGRRPRIPSGTARACS